MADSFESNGSFAASIKPYELYVNVYPALPV